ncbi:MAG: nucleotidyltransferase domain-containing protein [Bacteroidales bacterium]|nr:nucleotidyltransferase domain-containing protein [Bacteroidales bacterium]
MNSLITSNLERIKQVCDSHFVDAMYVFGSSLTNKFNAQSDVDLLVSFKAMDYADYADNYFETAEQLEEIFERPVDLVTENSLKNPYFIQSINQSKVLLYGNRD